MTFQIKFRLSNNCILKPNIYIEAFFFCLSAQCTKSIDQHLSVDFICTNIYFAGHLHDENSANVGCGHVTEGKWPQLQA